MGQMHCRDEASGSSTSLLNRVTRKESTFSKTPAVANYLASVRRGRVELGPRGLGPRGRLIPWLRGNAVCGYHRKAFSRDIPVRGRGEPTSRNGLFVGPYLPDLNTAFRRIPPNMFLSSMVYPSGANTCLRQSIKCRSVSITEKSTSAQWKGRNKTRTTMKMLNKATNDHLGPLLESFKDWPPPAW